MQGGFIYRDEHGIFQQHNGGGMFGLATEEFIRVHVGAKIDVLTKRIDEALIEMARARVNPVETVKVVPAEPVKLYTVEVTKDGARIGTYHDVTHVYDERGGYSEQLNIYRTSGQVVLKGKDYSYSLTEQKAEPEKKQGNYEWVINADDLKVKGYGEWMRELYNSPCTQGQASNMRAHLEKEMGKKYDELMHKIELLELRLSKQEKTKSK